jgi:hypothetical protein
LSRPMRRIKPRATCMHDCFPCICASFPRYLFEYLLDFLPSPAAGAGAHILAGGLSSVRRHQNNVLARNRVPPTRVAADRAQSREFVRGAQFGHWHPGHWWWKSRHFVSSGGSGRTRPAQSIRSAGRAVLEVRAGYQSPDRADARHHRARKGSAVPVATTVRARCFDEARPEYLRQLARKCAAAAEAAADPPSPKGNSSVRRVPATA